MSTHVQVDGNFWPLKSVCAVGLTDSWLERLGFEYQTSSYGVRDTPKTYTKCAKLYPGVMIEIEKDQNNRYFRFIQLGDHAHGLEDVPLFFVHQLQNLCFDLTGVELVEEKPIEAR